MKKSLVLAMAMALGVTASAYAANPFSDVPAGHWAYDSVAKLAAAGVVDGYADGAFDGDKLMTRYEMAQIVAKAMAKGANVDKLAAEFADELDTLGVRVAKLEKGADAVKITGQMRYSYKSSDFGGAHENAFRSRLWVNGQINDDWSYTAMLQHWNNVDDDAKDEKVDFKRAYLEGKLGGLDIVAGRWNEFFYNANICDIFVDGVKATYGDDVKLSVMAAKVNADSGYVELVKPNNPDNAYLYAANLSGKIGAVDAYANYFNAEEACLDNSAYGKKEVYNVGVAFDFAKDLRLTYDYMVGGKKYEEKVSKDGWIARVDYKGASEAAGTWGAHVQYFDQPINAILSPTTDATTFTSDYYGNNMYGGGFEGWNVGVDYTLAKNIQLCVNYYDTESKFNNLEDEVIYTELYFNF